MIIIMKRIYVVVLLLLSCLMCSCNNNKMVDNSMIKQQQTDNEQEINIPYKVADRYFQNNDIKELPTNKITNEKDFEKYFGAAPVMGEDGEPTNIDFTKEYVIAVSEKETYYSTVLSPISLIKDEKGNIVFTYKIDKGDKQSYSIVPCLLIIVSNKYQGQVIIKQGL
jgi:DUF917 family protein